MNASDPRTPARSSRILSGLALLLMLLALLVGVGVYSIRAELGTLTFFLGILGASLLLIYFGMSLVTSRSDRGTRTVWLLLVGLQLLFLLSTLIFSSLLVFCILLQAVFSFFLILAFLPVGQGTAATGVLFLGVLVAIFIQIAWPYERYAPAPLTSAVLAVFSGLIAVSFLYFIVTRFRDFSLYYKLLLVLSIIVIGPTAVIGALSVRELDRSLRSQAFQNLSTASRQTAYVLDTFVNTGLSNIRVDSQSPSLMEFLDRSARGSLDPTSQYNASAALSALRRKDPIFILSYALLDLTGRNVLDTQPQNIGDTEAQFAYFSGTITSGLPYASTVLIPPTDNIASIYFCSPVRDPEGRVLGILRARYDASILQKLVGQQAGQAGTGSFALLVDENHIILANGYDPFSIFLSVTPLNAYTLSTLQSEGHLPAGRTLNLNFEVPELEYNLTNGISQFNITTARFGEANSGGQAAATFLLSTLPWTVVFLENQASFLTPINIQIQNSILIVVAAVLVATLAGIGLSRLITTPLVQLTATASQIEQGDLSAVASLHAKDEIGALANSFNTMTTRLRDLVAGLEKRVAERTADLEHRAVQLQAAADVGSTAARLHNVEALLDQISKLISQRFGYYHVGIFLLDERSEYAVLAASNSEGGKKMLARGHRLKVGQTGIVGFVTGNKQPRIALDVGQDAVFFDNPDLPATRSEMALPLMVGGSILGALDVQSTEPSAFGPTDVTTLTVLADQIAIALENARLFDESQKALEMARRAYGEVSRTGWEKFHEAGKTVNGYVCFADDSIVPSSGTADPEISQALQSGSILHARGNTRLVVPIKVRDMAIGAVRLDKSAPGETWSEEETETVASIAEQLGIAVESARLFSESSERAEKESLIADVSGRIGSSIDIDKIMQTTLEEIGRLFENSEVVMQFKEGR